ncbi:MAG: RIP metalloprotease RseP [Candidatus Doudnabacteria bacterium]|nr:RIP metalloprotease RseP [Candidatus Doudnabacteria bacterium]
MIITIIIFIIILGILVFVHEFGHFIVAKKSGMRVDEFGFGFPPRIAGIQKVNGRLKWVWGHKDPLDTEKTVYSFNWIPLGGFVKIRGENNEGEDDPRSFINRPFWGRFFTLVAGVCMNLLLACCIFIGGYMVGLPVAVNSLSEIPAHSTFSQPQIGILDVLAGEPAAKAGILPNDVVVSVDGQSFTAISDLQSYVGSHKGQSLDFVILRDKKELTFHITPLTNPGPDQGPTGIELALVGRLKYSPVFAIIEGVKTTGMELSAIVGGLYQLFSGQLGFSSLGGPVKIAKLTGQVAGMGFVFLMQFMAFLSLNLAVLNILPFPALDGGRVLFLLVEKIRGKRNNQKFEQIANTAGFVFLILLMVAVTINDIVRK